MWSTYAHSVALVLGIETPAASTAVDNAAMEVALDRIGIFGFVFFGNVDENILERRT